MQAKLSPEIKHRDQFGQLLTKRDIHGVGAEVGVHRGAFSKIMMTNWATCDRWIGIDPYPVYNEFPARRDIDAIAATVMMAVHPQSHKADLMAMTAQQAIDHGLIPDDMTFVYIDGEHTYDAAKRDIETMWPRIHDRGILAGHDYCRYHPGVIRAVDEFFGPLGRTIWRTHDEWSSWFAYKNEPAEYVRCFE